MDFFLSHDRVPPESPGASHRVSIPLAPVQMRVHWQNALYQTRPFRARNPPYHPGESLLPEGARARASVPDFLSIACEIFDATGASHLQSVHQMPTRTLSPASTQKQIHKARRSVCVCPLVSSFFKPKCPLPTKYRLWQILHIPAMQSPSSRCILCLVGRFLANSDN